MRLRRFLIPVSVFLVVALGVGLYLFQPWRVFTVRETRDALLVPPATVQSTVQPTASSAPVPVVETPKEVAAGEWRSLEHATTGKASLIELPGGGHSVQFASLNTSDGPDLYVYLSPHVSSSSEKTFGQGFTSLGKLKGNRGDQVYAIPAGVDVSTIRSVVIWCQRFSAGFAVAPLERA
ncbi:Electron transfer DM13 [Lentzea albidocapillata subsp. violacea]|uniref:Electron transfer DM13 n=1 Tax=Lentzea albidocapillata subsp. violacea TaxID=128104 RepID=A0A1G9SPY3_9PSEU|nr:DM13 domain-containing protein [Lentzea albidocapillata]SDM37407.1 Electron transfer DM13 [Lentzea albidocapillata subsp. violacea]